MPSFTIADSTKEGINEKVEDCFGEKVGIPPGFPEVNLMQMTAFFNATCKSNPETNLIIGVLQNLTLSTSKIDAFISLTISPTIAKNQEIN